MITVSEGKTLLLQLSAPFQSWGGSNARLKVRKTDLQPTKSGVIGMIAASMGIGRKDGSVGSGGYSLRDLSLLSFGVRVDQPGRLEQDYQIARKNMERDYGGPGSKNDGNAFITERWYLADAVFLVGLHGEDDLINTIRRALEDPVWPLYYGRKSCPATGVGDDELVIGVTDKDLRTTLEDEPCRAKRWSVGDKTTVLAEAIIDSDEDGVVIKDAPLSFDPTYRKYGKRYVESFKVITKVVKEH